MDELQNHEKIRTSLVGKKFGQFTVLKFDHVDKHRSSCWLCECDCGNRIIIWWVDMRTQGNNRSSNRIIEFEGYKHTVAEWARILGVNDSTLRGRIARNDMRDFEKYFDEHNDH